MMSNMLLHNLTRNLSSMSNLHRQGSDGKRVHRPSDDPIAIAKILKFNTDLSDLDQYRSNIKDALSWYQVSESSIEDMSSALKRMRELAVQAANTATNTPDDLKKIKFEIAQLREHLVNAGNFSYAGKYVFSGYQNDKPLFKTEVINGKRVVSYNVDVTGRDVHVPQKMRYEVGQAEQIQVSTNGLEIFGVTNPEDKKYKMQVNFDPAQDYSAQDMVISVGKRKYTVKTTLEKETENGIQKEKVPFTTKEEIERAFSNAKDADGNKLSAIASIKFDPVSKILSIEEKFFDRQPIDFSGPLPAGITNKKLDFQYNYNVYGKMFTDTSGSNRNEGISSIQGKFDRTRDYTHENLNIKITDQNGVEVTFQVDPTLMDGRERPLEKSLILERYMKATPGAGAPPWAGTKLSDIADVYYDDHENLVIKPKKEGFGIKAEDPNAIVRFAESRMGVSSKKTQLVGDFVMDGPLSDYRASTLRYVIDEGKPTQRTFTVDTGELTGDGFKLKREKVLEKIRNAEDGNGNKLKDYADVFFNQEGKLVVKHKKFGSEHTLKAEFTPGAPATADSYKPELLRGVDKIESKVSFQSFDSFDDQYIRDHEEELKTNSIFLTYNGERKEIIIDKNAILNNIADYKKELQKAIDKTVGENKIIVGPRVTAGNPNAAFTADKFLSFETIGTQDGIVPEIQVEPVVASKSSLIEDIDRFIQALDEDNQEIIDRFLGRIDVHMDRVLSVRADLGAKTNRMELALERTKDNVLTFTKSLSKVEDVDLAETIMKLKNYENVYRASLSMGSKIIQPSLVDFLR